jgi:hypothetical protein
MTKGYINSHRSRIRNLRIPVVSDPSDDSTQVENFDWQEEESVDNLLLYFGAVPHKLLKYVTIPKRYPPRRPPHALILLVHL